MPADVINVLLIDDDAGFASIVKHLLGPFQGRAFNVRWENDGAKALELLGSENDIHLVLMDYYLPNMNGLEIIKLMYEQKITLPVIILTANKDFRTAVEAMKYGVEDYLLKEETTDTILPRTILNAIDRVNLKHKITDAEKRALLSRKRTEAIKELVVTMCHEFNNPLAAIKISASILSRQPENDDEKQLLEKLTANVSLLEQQIIKLRDINLEK